MSCTSDEYIIKCSKSNNRSSKDNIVTFTTFVSNVTILSLIQTMKMNVTIDLILNVPVINVV